MTKIIAFDFDGVLHKSVFFEEHGQGHPNELCLKSLKDKYKKFKDCVINPVIKDLIIKKKEEKNKIYIVTHNNLIEGIKEFLKVNGIFEYIEEIFSVKGSKYKKLNEIQADEFYDDSINVINDVLNDCNNEYCPKIFQVFPLEKGENQIVQINKQFGGNNVYYKKYLKYKKKYIDLKNSF